MLERTSRSTLTERAEKYGWLAACVTVRREQLGMRQAELADAAGCSARTVHALETGKPTVQLDRVIAVLDVLGIRLEVASGARSGVTATQKVRSMLGRVA